MGDKRDSCVTLQAKGQGAELQSILKPILHVGPEPLHNDAFQQCIIGKLCFSITELLYLLSSGCTENYTSGGKYTIFYVFHFVIKYVSCFSTMVGWILVHKTTVKCDH